MKVLHSWLQDYIEEDLPSADTLAQKLTMHAYEVESVELIDEDAVIDIDVLPNRASDSLSHIGIAREIAILFDLTLKLPETDFSSADFNSTELVDLTISQEVRRGSKRVAQDIKVRTSPKLIKNRLELLGQRSINNVVDITNYVMLETGQPVHAFDYDKIKGEEVESKSITIRPAQSGEMITLLDGSEFELDESILVIADEEKPLDIAGIKGGDNSAIDENTSRVLLSVCSFKPTNIRRASQKLDLRTDASKRFENDISPEAVSFAMERFSYLLAEHAEAQVGSDTVDVYPRQANPYKAGVSTTEVNKLLGTDLKDSEVENILKQLRFEFKRNKPVDRVLELAPQLVGRPYKYGASISYDAPEMFDCSSFISYLFAQVGVSVPRITIDQYVFGIPVDKDDLQPGDVIFSTNNGNVPKTEKFERVDDGAVVEQQTVHHQTVEYMSGKSVKEGVGHCGIYMGNGKVIHASGLWHEGEVIIEDFEKSLAFKNMVGFRRMIDDVERFAITVPHFRHDIRKSTDLIEEIGRVYGYENITPQVPKKNVQVPVNKEFYYNNTINNILTKLNFSEVYTYSFGEQGSIELKNPLAQDKNFLRSSLENGLREALTMNSKNKDILGLEKVGLFEIGRIFSETKEIVQLGIAASDAKMVKGVIDEIQNTLSVELNPDFKDEIALIDLDEIYDQLPIPSDHEKFPSTNLIKFKDISPYPYVLRDIAVWIPVNTAEDELTKIVYSNASELLVRITKFDEYQKDDRISYAYRLVFQASDRTLSDAEVNDVMKVITEELNKRKDFEVR